MGNCRIGIVCSTLLLMLTVPTVGGAQSIDPIDDPIAVHIHPQDNIIGVFNGYVFETYTLDYTFIDQLTIVDDPSTRIRQRNFVWSPDGSR